MKLPIKTISIIGSGNIAFHLANGFCNKGIIIKEIVGRNQQKVASYAKQFGAEPVYDIKKISTQTDLVIIAVSDHAIKIVADQLQLKNNLVVHTSGSVELNILKKVSSQIGVFYPLQTFSASKKSDFSVVPICTESSNDAVQEKLKELALQLTSKVYFLDSEKRKHIHLAAVISNNFINYLLNSTFDFLKEKGISKEILIPLIDETISRIIDAATDDIQTGPARRNDVETIQTHLQILETSPELRNIYKLMSDQIIKKYHGNKL